jgi:transcriptional regulator with XRE-family HTH domain
MAEPNYGHSHMGMHIGFSYRAATVHCMGSAGQRIRDLRKIKELTQPQLASAVGINQSTLSDIERGAGFSAEILMRLADELETPADFIMRGQSAAWPFSSVELARYLALDRDGRLYVEAKLEAAIESREETTTPPPRAGSKDGLARVPGAERLRTGRDGSSTGESHKPGAAPKKRGGGRA